DRAALVAMAGDGRAAELPPGAALLLSQALAQVKESDAALGLFLRVQRRHPGDPWLNAGIADLLGRSARREEAVGYWRAFLAARPDSPAAHTSFASRMQQLGRLPEAEAAVHQALRLEPESFEGHFQLASLRTAQRRPADAEAASRAAARIRPSSCVAQYNLATLLWEQGKPAEAEAPFREALRIRPDFPAVHVQFGDLLAGLGKPAGAVEAYREALRRQPDYPEAHCNLGHALLALGRFEAAREELRRGHEIGTKRPGWPHPSAAWLATAGRLAGLEARLPALLRGTERPADAAEAAALADLCLRRRLHAASVRFFEQASADPASGRRYDAACSAAQAGCGRGEDAADLDATERRRMRRQALTWLTAELAACRRRLDGGGDDTRATVAGTTRHWQKDPDLAVVRGPEALALLPEDEREGWADVWRQIEALCRRARGGER
ncbi:MAG: tetratricopeptide repeat protein, partial [Gemmataceae bacterium]